MGLAIALVFDIIRDLVEGFLFAFFELGFITISFLLASLNSIIFFKKTKRLVYGFFLELLSLIIIGIDLGTLNNLASMSQRGIGRFRSMRETVDSYS